MSVLHVLLPPATDDDPALRRWLARADRLPDLSDARSTTLRSLFHWSGEEIPAAALRHHAHGDDAGDGTWACADPAYVRSEATGARLAAWPFPDLSVEEARELATTLMPLFADAGARLVVDTPQAWCLHLAEGDGTTFTDPVAALGTDLLECLPAGDAGRHWRRWFNEAQIALHAHPLNAARVAAGQPPVNALWFWGAGPLPESVETRLAAVASPDDLLGGLAKVAHASWVQPSPQAVEALTEQGDVLLDLDGVHQTDVSARWLAWFQRGLRRRRFDAIELAFPAGERFRARHAHRLRFWRHG